MYVARDKTRLLNFFFVFILRGVNVVPFLEYIGLPDKLVDLMEKSQSGYAITAYAMYKVRALACMDGRCLQPLREGLCLQGHV